jgi:hypothetical protein
VSSDPVSGALVKAGAEATTEAAKGVVSRILGPPLEEVGEQLRLMVRAKFTPLRTKWLTQVEAGELALEAATRRLAGVPPETLVTPRAEVVAGVVEGLQTRADVPELRAMFVELLAAAMQANTEERAHPAFAEIIRQLTPDEARLLRTLTKSPSILATFKSSERGNRELVDHRIRAAWRRIHAAAETPSDLETFGRAVNNHERLGLLRYGARKFSSREDPNLETGLMDLQYEIDFTPFGREFAGVCIGALEQPPFTGNAS